jgi:hypothetical protein
MNQKIYVKCPLDGHENQKYCGLVEHYKDTGTTNTCEHREQCHEMKTYIKHEEHQYETK